MPICSITLIRQKPRKLPTIFNTIGGHIRKRRIELGLLQRDVGKRIGVDGTTVHNWERNYTSPALRNLPKVVEFLGYDPARSEPETFGEELLKYRKNRGMTQKELARQIGIDPSTLSRLERANGTRFGSVLKKVSDFLNRRSWEDTGAKR